VALTPGTRLGIYEVIAQIGEGGMGQVYRARDTTLNRDVALKLLPDAFVSDPDRLARFTREAQMLASLNHPNIAHIHGLEESHGVRALVMELVEGEDLSQRIARGAIAADDALPIAKQIAEALEAAHEQGIIHRDLKPANIKVRDDGTVKVLDFGLAKAMEPVGIACNASQSPTITTPAMTHAGIILGTAAYMAPEQARGKAVDKRADIWAFGVVLYEMLTGRRLFERSTVSDTVTALLTEEPEWEDVPQKIRPLLRRCIEKDPKRRLRDIADAWVMFEETVTTVPSRSNKTLSMVTAVLVIAVLSLGTALWRAEHMTDPPPQPVLRLDLDLGPDISLGSGIGPTAILSPDGLRLVIVSQDADGIRRLFTRRLDQPKATALTDSEGAYAPFFSPDAQWVGFFAGGKLKKISIDGGKAVSLFDAPAGRGASWGEDDSIVAALDSQVGLSRVPAAGGNVTAVTEVQSGENSHRWPQILPGGKAVLFSFNTSFANFDEAGIAVALEDRRTKTVLEHAGMYPQYLRSGHLIYVKKGTLFAVPFDLDRLEVRGDPTRIVEEISSDPNFGFAQVVASQTGTALYRKGRAEGFPLVQWLNGAGQIEPLLPEPAPYQFLRLSPDGGRIATVVPDGPNSVLWIYDWRRGARIRLTIGAGVNTFPVWNPDGQYVVFHSAGGMFSARADGAGKPHPLTHSELLQYPGSFSPDGKRLVFSEANAGLGASLRTVTLETKDGHLQASKQELFLSLRSVNAYPAFSPDGRWLAYASSESGIYDVYVRAYPDKGSQWQVSNNGGTMPVWSRNGHELFYRTEDQRIMVANYAVKGDSFVAEKPRVWSRQPLANLGLTPNFDLAPDGKRFAVVMAAESPKPREAQSHITLVLNFFNEVSRRAAGTSR
jgi:serine/threonine protein kinase/Tol biopolymer transport system component